MCEEAPADKLFYGNAVDQNVYPLASLKMLISKTDPNAKSLFNRWIKDLPCIFFCYVSWFIVAYSSPSASTWKSKEFRFNWWWNSRPRDTKCMARFNQTLKRSKAGFFTLFLCMHWYMFGPLWIDTLRIWTAILISFTSPISVQEAPFYTRPNKW
jgi:hypothetical protein